MDNKHDWTKNCVYFLRRLKSLNIYRMMLRMFYESVLASVILFAVVCLGSKLRVADTNRLHKLIGKASEDVRLELDSDGSVERRMLSKLHAIVGKVSHPLPDVLVSHRSTFSQRLPPRSTTERQWKSCLLPWNFTTPSSGCWTLKANRLFLSASSPQLAHINQLFIIYLQSCTTDSYSKSAITLSFTLFYILQTVLYTVSYMLLHIINIFLLFL